MAAIQPTLKTCSNTLGAARRNSMRVLVACEFSGVVRDAFAAKGHDAWSCDLLPSEAPGQHIQGDVREILNDNWDLLIAHPPCTHLSSSGAAWFKVKRADGRQAYAIDFFLAFTRTKIPRWCIENPVGIVSTIYRQPDQIIQPFQFGDPVKKTTCLWLRGLCPLFSHDRHPLFAPVNKVVEPELVTLKTGKTFSKWDYEISKDHKNRAHLRSRTFNGIAQAMADQWSPAS